jgi:peptidoglycan/LPS O-acetylase OafA/YrhL
MAIAFGLWRLGLVATRADWARIYYGTDTNAYAILTGSFIAVARLPKLHPNAGLAAIAGLVWIGIRPWGAEAVGLSFVAVALAAVVVHVAAISLPALEMAWLRWFGTISYGLYLWHTPIMDAVQPPDRWRVVPLAVLMAWASWVWVERPILYARPRKETSNREGHGILRGV